MRRPKLTWAWSESRKYAFLVVWLPGRHSLSFHAVREEVPLTGRHQNSLMVGLT